MAESFASAARYSDDENVVTMATNVFWYRTPCRSRVGSNRPAWMLVPSRAPMAPKIVPRMPFAAGMRMMRPGRARSVLLIELRVTPATSAAPVLTSSATKPCRSVRRSERR